MISNGALGPFWCKATVTAMGEVDGSSVTLPSGASRHTYKAYTTQYIYDPEVDRIWYGFNPATEKNKLYIEYCPPVVQNWVDRISR